MLRNVSSGLEVVGKIDCNQRVIKYKVMRNKDENSLKQLFCILGIIMKKLF